ncbi:MAG TPA: tetratricopeptide repeat protein [Planctomycetota bacterium]|nr:tetratricopeptide repeat protein [Planctomycetota bacterium]
MMHLVLAWAVLFPQEAEGFLKSAEYKQQQRDAEGALADFTRALEMNPKLAAAWYGRGVLLSNKGQLDRALADYSKAIEADPKFAKAYFSRAILRSYRNDDEGALADYGKAVESDPSYGKAWFNRGLLRSGRKDYDGAIGDFTRAIGVNGADIDAWFNRGNAWAAKGDHEKAIFDYSKVVELKPTHSAAYVYRGDCQARKGDAIAAMLDFTRAIEMNPKDAEAFYFRGHANYDRQAWSTALDDFKKAYDLNRLSAVRTDTCELRLWAVRARMGQSDVATAELKAYIAKERRGGRPNDWFSTVAAFLAGDQPEAAFLESAPSKAESCDAHFYAAVKRLAKKDAAGARELLKKALATGITDTPEASSVRAELEALGK